MTSGYLYCSHCFASSKLWNSKDPKQLVYTSVSISQEECFCKQRSKMLFILFHVVIPFVSCGNTIMFEILVFVLFYFTSRPVHFRASSISNIGCMNVFLWIDTQITNVQFLILWSWMSVSWIDTLHLDTSLMISFHWNIFIVVGTCQAKESHIESSTMHQRLVWMLPYNLWTSIHLPADQVFRLAECWTADTLEQAIRSSRKCWLCTPNGGFVLMAKKFKLMLAQPTCWSDKRYALPVMLWSVNHKHFWKSTLEFIDIHLCINTYVSSSTWFSKLQNECQDQDEYLFSSFSLHNPADYTPSVEDERYRKQSMQSPLSSLAPSSTFENWFSLLALLFDFFSPNLSESALNQ